MKTTRDVKIDITICDFCGEETNGCSHCYICKRDCCATHLKNRLDTLGAPTSGNLSIPSSDIPVCPKCFAILKPFSDRLKGIREEIVVAIRDQIHNTPEIIKQDEERISKFENGKWERVK